MINDPTMMRPAPPRHDRIEQIAKEIDRHWTPGEPPPEFTYDEEDRAVCKVWMAITLPLIRAHGCQEILESLDAFNLDGTDVPQQREVSLTLEGLTNFRLRPTTGLLVDALTFLGDLDRGIFPANAHLRSLSSPFWSADPDWLHELLHACSLAHPDIAAVYRMFGRAGQVARTDADIEALSRVFWFSLEMGLVEEAVPKALGAAILSSPIEMANVQTAELRAFDPWIVASQSFVPQEYQPVFFVAASFQSMSAQLSDYLDDFRAQRI